jgi:hypothetical protein
VTLRDEVFREAAGVVHASASARLRNNPEDAQLVIHDFITESMAKGIPHADCWMLLFSAAVGRYSDAIIGLAKVKGVDPELELGNAAIYSART